MQRKMMNEREPLDCLRDMFCNCKNERNEHHMLFALKILHVLSLFEGGYHILYRNFFAYVIQSIAAQVIIPFENFIPLYLNTFFFSVKTSFCMKIIRNSIFPICKCNWFSIAPDIFVTDVEPIAGCPKTNLSLICLKR